MAKFSSLIKILALIGIVTIVGVTFKNKNTDTLPLVAITQIVDHNTLDTVRRGLIQKLEAEGFVDGKTIKLVYQNANGNVTVASQIAKQFIALQPKVIVALSTQSAQLLKQPAQEARIPLIFSAVTDPIAAKLVTSFSDTDQGVTGVSDFMPAEPQLQMMRTFLPSLKKLGVIYNPSEINSVSFLEKMKKVAARDNIEFVFVAINTTAEASSAVASVIGKVEALYFPNDNTAMAAAGAIAQVALKHKLPVFANDLASVELGIMAALSYDRVAMGAKTADIVGGILQGKSTKDFPVTNDVPLEMVVSQRALEQIGLELPVTLSMPARLIP